MSILGDISPGDFLLRNTNHGRKSQPLTTLHHINLLQVSTQAHLVAVSLGSFGLRNVWGEQAARILALGHYVLYDGALDVLLGLLTQAVVIFY